MKILRTRCASMSIFDLRTHFHLFRSSGLLVTGITLKARIRSRTAAIMSFCIFVKLSCIFFECHPTSQTRALATLLRKTKANLLIKA
jgi:hypothetical protein